MASYGVFQAVCGFEYHGPKGNIGFAPRLKPEDFKAAFITAEGWGTFTQRRQGNTQHETIEVKWGRLTLRSLAFAIPKNMTVNQVKISTADKVLYCRHDLTDERLVIVMETTTTLETGQTMTITIS
jgi:non-lysosomal glucosylceramidase